MYLNIKQYYLHEFQESISRQEFGLIFVNQIVDYLTLSYMNIWIFAPKIYMNESKELIN